MDTETSKIKMPNRMAAIENLPIGESISICHRVDLTYGLTNDEKNKHTARLRGNLDSQVNKARRKYSARRYTVETLIAPTSQAAALVIVAVATRTD